MSDFNARIANAIDAYFLISDVSNRSVEPWLPLIQLPEHSPGAQLVRVTSSQDRATYRHSQSDADIEIPSGHYMVFNCEFFVPIRSIEDGFDPAQYVPQASYEAFVNSFMLKYKTKLGSVSAPPVGKPRTTLVTNVQSSAGERFWRLSAYSNDRRLTSDRQFVKDTYVTTDSDIEFVASGLAGVGRYALPNPFPAIYAFSIFPNAGTPIELGTVRPLFGQAGGGVEGVLKADSGSWTVSNHLRVLPTW